MGAGVGDRHMRVPARPGEGPQGVLGEPVVRVRPAGVVQGQSASVRPDQVDRALGPGGLRDRGQGDAVLLVQGTDEVALGVVAEEVEVVGVQAEAAEPDGDEIPGLTGAGADPAVDHVAVGVRERQLGDVHDGVHPGPAQHEHVDVAAQLAPSPWS